MTWRGGMVIFLVISLVLVSAGLLLAQQMSTQEITPNDEFFYVSLTEPLNINASEWTLVVNGTVDNPYNITYDQLLAMPNRTETATLRCVDGPSGRAEYVGVQLSYLLDLAGVQNSSKKVVLRSPDGYSTDLRLEDAYQEDVILAYGMNNRTLPPAQGYPAKLVVPEQWGYKWAKWVTNIEVVDYDYKGYWESRGWDDAAYLDPRTDWWWHALSLSLAAVVGGFAGITGAVDSRRRDKGLAPLFPPAYHRTPGYIFSLLVLIIFAWWAVETFSLRSSVLYTLHGLLAFSATFFVAIGLLAGMLLARKSEEARGWHWGANAVGYTLMLLTMLTGLFLAF